MKGDLIAINCYPDFNGELLKFGYTDFPSLVKTLKKINTNCLAHGFETEIRIKFPLMPAIKLPERSKKKGRSNV